MTTDFAGGGTMANTSTVERLLYLIANQIDHGNKEDRQYPPSLPPYPETAYSFWKFLFSLLSQYFSSPLSPLVSVATLQLSAMDIKFRILKRLSLEHECWRMYEIIIRRIYGYQHAEAKKGKSLRIHRLVNPFLRASAACEFAIASDSFCCSASTLRWLK